MKTKVISCQIFEPYINYLKENEKVESDIIVHYLEIDSHNHPEELRKQIQLEIDETVDVDLIILLYGICGNATNGIVARSIDVVIPKVHDCATILLGGKEQYESHFGHRPSQSWNSIAYFKETIHKTTLETNPVYLDFLEKYGEENALYLMEVMYPPSGNKLYITLGLDKDKERIQSMPDETEVVSGDISMIMNLLNCDFDDVLLLKENEAIVPVYDKEQVMTKK